MQIKVCARRVAGAFSLRWWFSALITQLFQHVFSLPLWRERELMCLHGNFHLMKRYLFISFVLVSVISRMIEPWSYICTDFENWRAKMYPLCILAYLVCKCLFEQFGNLVFYLPGFFNYCWMCLFYHENKWFYERESYLFSPHLNGFIKFVVNFCLLF